MSSSSRIGRIFAHMSLAYLGLWAAACGTPTNDPNPPSGAALDACQPKSAQIAIGDGFSKILCGCAEPAGTVVGAGLGQLTCTIPVGTTLTFQYMTTLWRHQIIPKGNDGFPPSRMYDPFFREANRVHSFKLNTTGSFPYVDAFNSEVSGTLVVQ